MVKRTIGSDGHCHGVRCSLSGVERGHTAVGERYHRFGHSFIAGTVHGIVLVHGGSVVNKLHVAILSQCRGCVGIKLHILGAAYIHMGVDTLAILVGNVHHLVSHTNVGVLGFTDHRVILTGSQRSRCYCREKTVCEIFIEFHLCLMIDLIFSNHYWGRLTGTQVTVLLAFRS